MAYKPKVLAIAEGGTNASTMATTDGIVFYDGTSLVTTSAGTAAQVLTSNGAGVAPTFQAAGGAATSGNLVLLSNQTASASSSISFTSLLSSTYDEYVFDVYGVTTSGGNNIIWIQLSTDNGSTWLNTTYYTNGIVTNGDGSSGGYSFPNTTGFELTDRFPNGSTVSYLTYLRLYNVNSSSLYKQFIAQSTASGNIYSGNTLCFINLSGVVQNTSVVNAVKFFPGTGNFATGTFKLFGVVK